MSEKDKIAGIAHKEAYEKWWYNSDGFEYKSWLEIELYQTKKELEELQDAIADKVMHFIGGEYDFGSFMIDSTDPLFKHIEASRKRNKT